MENGKQGAFACVDSQKQYLQEGLTKREYFAGLAMQALLTSGRRNAEYHANTAKSAINMADELLKQLEEKK